MRIVASIVASFYRSGSMARSAFSTSPARCARFRRKAYMA
jgi:hypothetical protein